MKLFKLFFMLIFFTPLLLAEPTSTSIEPDAQMQAILHQSSTLSPTVLELGLRAYHRAEAAGLTKKPILTLIDYSMGSSKKRLWVIDLQHNIILFNTLVAHGKGSGYDFAHHFSDLPQSNASSIGTYLTRDAYIGKHGYSLKLQGLCKGYNDAAYQRAIVIHEAWYVSDNFIKKYGRLGRSLGCMALERDMATKIINKTKDGTIMLAYFPDKHWLETSKFVKPGSDGCKSPY